MYQIRSCIFSLSESSSSAEEEEDKLSLSLHEGHDGVSGSTLGSGSVPSENEELEKEGSVPLLGQSHLHHSDNSVPVHSDAYSDGTVGDGGRKEHSDMTKNNSEDDDKKSWSAVTLEVNQHSAVNMVSENHHSQHQDHQGHRNIQSQASSSSRPPNRDPPAGRRRHSSEKTLPVSFSNSGQRVITGGLAAAFAAILFLLNAYHMYSM
jgi:hypothetical protein